MSPATTSRSRRGQGGQSARNRRRRNTGARRWSQRVTDSSDAMDLEPQVFRDGNATQIAESLKTSSLHSRRRKGTPFQSAMSMLNFYINRAGRNLPRTRRETLQRAKRQLRIAFGRKP